MLRDVEEDTFALQKIFLSSNYRKENSEEIRLLVHAESEVEKCKGQKNKFHTSSPKFHRVR